MSSDGSLSSSPTNLTNDVRMRPNGALRAASEAAVPHAEGQSDVEDLRGALERNWSTSNITNNNNSNGIGNGQQRPGAVISREEAAANAAQIQMAQSWSSGFGEITPSVAFDHTSRRSSTGTARNMLPPTHQRTASEGAAPRLAVGQAVAVRVSSAMHDAARLKDWPRVLEIARQDPKAAS